MQNGQDNIDDAILQLQTAAKPGNREETRQKLAAFTTTNVGQPHVRVRLHCIERDAPKALVEGLLTELRASMDSIKARFSMELIFVCIEFRSKYYGDFRRLLCVPSASFVCALGAGRGLACLLAPP